MSVAEVQFEHYRAPNTLGVQETAPRLSWKIKEQRSTFSQRGYEVKLTVLHSSLATRHSTISQLVPWPFDDSLQSRQRVSVSIRAWDDQGESTSWSEPVELEIGLLKRSNWVCEQIAAPWAGLTKGPDCEQLFRKQFHIDPCVGNPLVKARLYITSQGVYEAEINGIRVGDHFMAPGWTSYAGRIQYQTYDVLTLLKSGQDNCIGVRVAEGWFSGRLGFRGGHRDTWGSVNALLMQLELTFQDGAVKTVATDQSWMVTRGPIRLAEIYDGEKYDATLEVPL
ncbi:unnamed protein product [Clonostachys rhizophaga]|uniref:Bacterial alpha-L-rhamnosidase N-terminal domain-containing protein n=1 Tax=Clonostachys rhizophaga TaxID=160324 RepID=A0A9N9V7L2_9HYPO|nr:unnamed protein product [Clonostachys rhizophaga]